MTITEILILLLTCIVIYWLAPKTGRGWLVLCASLLGLFWLQPQTSIRYLDFWFPLASITLTWLAWAAVQPRPAPRLREYFPTIGITLALVVALALNRYLGSLCCLAASRPPTLWLVLTGLGISIAMLLITFLLRGKVVNIVVSILIISLFILLKYPPLALAASAGLRTLSGQDALLAAGVDLRWLGYSYLAFRLLGVLQDARAGRSIPAQASEFINYALFLPALSAGPIDRLPRFLDDLRQPPATRNRTDDLIEGSRRIVLGLVKKFALADSLALFALNPLNAVQASPGVWSWVLLYAYALRIYFDFSGYTDIAIGLARLTGIRLPENFDAPYAKTSLTAFWNAWHITLAQWFRSYFFNPLTRWLRQKQGSMPAWVMILIGQAGVMLLIGLWHGITWNFAIWGLWHATGLFIHNRWSDFLRPRRLEARMPPLLHRVLSAGGWFITFHFVVLGWVWFVLPDPHTGWLYLQKLAGLG